MFQPDSLLDITAKIVAVREPFQKIEERYARIPEPIIYRIIFYSFPRNEKDICMYSSLSRISSFNSVEYQNLSFYKGLKLLESECVENVLQVGFHLSGIVWTYPPTVKERLIQSNSHNSNVPYFNENQNSNNNQSSVENSYSNDENRHYKVSLSFDRCKIIAVTCSCDTKDIFWCQHVVALALYRIRNANSVKLRVPISETLLQMNRQQLQKFVQYLIAEHHTEVLPTAQKLADEILQQKSEINIISGAPDPTAGAAKDDDNSWHLDESQVCDAVRSYLGQGSYYNSNKQLNSLFGKVREMLRAQDSNGARMLTLITEQFLSDPRLTLWKSHGTPMNEKCRQLWDQLGALWVCIVLNPYATKLERLHWKTLLEKWSKIDICPQEDPDFRPLTTDNYRDRSHRQRERERHRYFRENNARNNINYNRPPRYEDRGGINYQQPAAVEQDSDSSDSDESEEEESVEPANDFNRGDDVSENEMADVVKPSDENNGHGFVLEKIAIVDESLNEGAGPSRLIEIFPISKVDSSKNVDHPKGIFSHSAEIDDSSRESFEGNEGVDVRYPKFYTGSPRMVENVEMLMNSLQKVTEDEKVANEAAKNVALNENSDESVDFMEENNRAEPIPAVNEKKEQSAEEVNVFENVPEAPPQNPEPFRPNKKQKINNSNNKIQKTSPRTIFHKALDAVSMNWENDHLKNIMASDSCTNAKSSNSSSKPSSSTWKSNFNGVGQPLWHEPMSMCAARIDSLRSHGHSKSALRLSVSVVRTMKQIQADGQLLWQKYKQQNNKNSVGNKRDYNTMVDGCKLCCCNCRTSKTTPAPYHDSFVFNAYKPCQEECCFNKSKLYNNKCTESFDKYSTSSSQMYPKTDCHFNSSFNKVGPAVHHKDSSAGQTSSQRRNHFCRKPINDSDDDDDDDDEEYNYNKNAKKIKMSDCIQCCSRASDQSASTSGKKTLVSSPGKNPEQTKNDLYKIINYGASTSKAGGTSKSNIAQFKTNRKSDCVSNCLDCTTGCEVEFPLDAVACIFDCLIEACVSTSPVNTEVKTLPDSPIVTTTDDGSIIQTKYKHVLVPGSSDKNESYLTLAFEASILALGKQKIMPNGLYSQHVICKQQDQLINRLRNIDLDSVLIIILKNMSLQLMDGGPSSGFGEIIHLESIPMHTLARFLFTTLLNQYPNLAYDVGLRAMRFPVLEKFNGDITNGNERAPISNSYYREGFMAVQYPRWWTLGHLETQQCSLSSTMLSAAKGDSIRLASVLQSSRQNIHSSSHLFKLAQDAFRFATPENGPRSQTLLGVAFELGLQVMRMTLTCINWRRREMVRWLVTCASHVGVDALMSIMKNWYHLFTPTEATGPIATTVMSHSTIMRLNLNFKQQDELSIAARTLALQCAHKDPPNCALNALTLCENDPMTFETAYHIVIDSANHIMTSSQLFTIARYMEHRGYPARAYNLATLAIKNVHLAYNQDTHPAINDIHWACGLSHSLGKAELTKIIPIVIKNIQCATVLSDILRRSSVPTAGVPNFGSHQRGSNMRSYIKLSYDREPLNQLLDAAVAAFVNTTHSRLSHISPRHYGDFIDFLSKARDTFILAGDGPAHFSRLIENITVAYKGKKKLVRQVRQRFQFA